MRRPMREEDWEAVYREQLPHIYNYFRYRLWDEQLAEDLTATTFERAWRARASYDREKSQLSTWLFTIARRLAIDHLRCARPEVSLDRVRPPTAPDPPLEDLMQQNSDLARLAGMVGYLTDGERELISLRYGADLSNREIARLTGLTESNVGVILHRAIQRMRALWETVL